MTCPAENQCCQSELCPECLRRLRQYERFWQALRKASGRVKSALRKNASPDVVARLQRVERKLHEDRSAADDLLRAQLPLSAEWLS